ncbi:DUF1801 domain-containing protein [Algoriphagus sp. H41]|uniref:DUF1801 domain-containing protein n=1 Tax=Algoriphagus oliviformis TaxID=2811231 RepID=A0ABS3C5Z2_9BACT|nr:DUF1801 domain-containing protein [Algoriphagus oliviformis]MBN7812540.1 DUF1801 domain-containing protein [Algoriphagus oliviformis]
MAENKTKPTEVSVDDFINAVESPKKREDAFALKKMMEEITGEPAVMWGPSIVGFGSYHYKYATGHEGDAPIVGFSPRKAAHSLYLLSCEQQDFEPLLTKLGKYKRSVACLYANKLSDLNEDILRELIAKSYATTKAKYPTT